MGKQMRRCCMYTRILLLLFLLSDVNNTFHTLETSSPKPCSPLHPEIQISARMHCLFYGVRKEGKQREVKERWMKI